MKKRFLFVVALMAALALNVYAADSDYTVDANGVITKYSGFDTEITIPATIGGKKITAIGKAAFRKADLTSVVIPNGITEIGEDAFRDNKLTTITIPGSVKVIQFGAFNDNRDLATVVLSEGLEIVGGDAFPPFTVKSINIPASIRGFRVALSAEIPVTLAANITIDMSGVVEGNAIFYNYIANDRKAGIYTSDMKRERKEAEDFSYYETQYGAVLYRYSGDSTRVRIPAEIGGIAVKAIYSGFDRKEIVAVQIPEGITYIGREAFRNKQLQSVTIPQGVTYIGDSAFESNQLASLTISDTVVYIGARAFFENKLTSVTIPAGVTYLGALAFARNSIKTITIPPSVKTLGGNPLPQDTSYDSDNDGISIVIGANVMIEDDSIFAKEYNKNGRKAGRYTSLFDKSRSPYEHKWVYSAR